MFAPKFGHTGENTAWAQATALWVLVLMIRELDDLFLIFSSCVLPMRKSRTAADGPPEARLRNLSVMILKASLINIIVAEAAVKGERETLSSTTLLLQRGKCLLKCALSCSSMHFITPELSATFFDSGSIVVLLRHSGTVDRDEEMLKISVKMGQWCSLCL